jgi:hypothetical protein
MQANHQVASVCGPTSECVDAREQHVYELVVQCLSSWLYVKQFCCDGLVWLVRCYPTSSAEAACPPAIEIIIITIIIIIITFPLPAQASQWATREGFSSST